MHDSLLMQNISKNLSSICKNNNVKKITYLELAVNKKSPINEQNLHGHLMDMNKGLVDEMTKTKIVFEDIPDEMADIKRIEGEKVDINGR